MFFQLLVVTIAGLAVTAGGASAQDFAVGVNTFWGFGRNGNEIYLTSELVADYSTFNRARFNFTVVGEGRQLSFGDQSVSVSRTTGQVVPSETTSTFGVEELEGSRFRLSFNGEPLVTPNISAPFEFYVQSAYPDESAVGFFIWDNELGLEEIYAGERENIRATLDHIRTNFPDNLSVAYDSLLVRMAENGHVEGKEIFLAGNYINQDLGSESTVLLGLPPLVQYVVTGAETRLIYEVNSDIRYPAKLNTVFALENQTTFPYTFEANESGKWAIIYNSRAFLYVNDSLDLNNEIGETFSYVFDIYLGANFDNMSISAGASTEDDFLRWERYTLPFVANGTNSDKAIFRLQPFEIRVDGMYREEDLADLAYLINTRGGDQKEQFYTEIKDKLPAEYSGTQTMALGHFLKEDLGCDDTSIFDAPVLRVVELVVCGKPMSITFNHITAGSFIVKHSTATNEHTDVEPFTANMRPFFTEMGTIQEIHVAITYANNSYWAINPETKILEDGPFGGESFEFEIIAAEDGFGFQIRSIISETGRGLLVVTTNVPEFLFETEANNFWDAFFTFEEYTNPRK